MTEAIVPNVDPNVDTKEMIFRFKTDKLGNKRADVKFEKVPVPSAEGFAQILLKGGKEFDLLQEAAESVVRSALAEFVANDETIDPEKFDLNQVSWTTIANMDKTDRRSSSIPAETWEGFVKDYQAIMPSLTGKKPEAVSLATEIYVKKMTPVRSNKNALNKLKEQISLYCGTANAEQFNDVLELLVRRIDNYLKADEPVILAENL